MPFGDVTNLATAQAADEERKRRRELATLALEEADLKRDMAARKAADALGPAGVLDDLLGSGGRRAAVSADVLKNAAEDRFLNEQAQTKFERRQQGLDRRETALAVPGKTAAERQTEMLAPLGPFATEDPTTKAQELLRDPRGREQRLLAQREKIAGPNVSRETPIYTDAPRARGSRRTEEGTITPGGTGAATMPYQGALDELLGLEVPRAGIRKEFGGTAEDRTLSFSDRREPGMRRYNSNAGTTKDVGAPGGGLVAAGRKPDPAKDALLGGLDELLGETKRQPFTPQERAEDLAVQQPGWDTMASRTTPEDIRNQLNTAVGEGRLNPATGQYLQQYYKSIADDAYDANGDFNPEIWQGRLAQGRKPAPGEAEARAKTGGTAVPEAQAAERAATTAALTPPPGGPGATRSPSLAAEQATAGPPAEGNAERPSAQRWAGGATAPPEVAAGIARIGVPALAAAAGPATGGLSIAALLAGGAGGEALAESAEGADYDPAKIAGAGVLGMLGGKVLPAAIGGLVNRVQGLRGATGFGRALRAVGNDRPAGLSRGGLPDDPITSRGSFPSLRDRAIQQTAQQGSASIPETDLFRTLPPDLQAARLPALRGGGEFTLGRLADESPDIEALIEAYLRQSRRLLPGPAGVGGDANLPALRGGGFVMR